MSTAFNKEFYRSLIDQNKTTEVPSSWFFVLADIKGSTQASQKGQYERVNYIGSAAIAAVRNEFGNKSIPFVFGGDGATFLVPPENLERLLAVLNALKDLALNQMGFHLRVEAIKIERVRAKQAIIRCGFVRVGPSEGFHFFRGNGISVAEKMLKNGEGDTFAAYSQLSPVNLKGLSCRISPFQPLNGTILNVIIEPLGSLEDEDRIFEEIFLSCKNFNGLCPITIQNHFRPWISSKPFIEARLNKKSTLLMFIEYFITKLLFKLNIRNSVVGLPTEYTEALLIQSDWIKMDGYLRMVLDVDQKTKAQLISTLESLSALKKIRFGISHSDSVVMTCHLFSAEKQEHVHFVDGSSCGLTRAATNLKDKLKLEVEAEA
jgi:hypothetical protein